MNDNNQIQFQKNTILLILLFNIWSFYTYAQLSPGDLAEPHAHLEGLSNCTQCHTLGEKISDDKCLKCHTHLNDRITQNKGYHVSTEVKGKSCISCHSDHHGRKFDMIHFKTNEFNHDLTGYLLEGKHEQQNCEDCHKKDFISNNEILKKNRTYLGLNTTCLTCHTDYHQQTLSNDCAQCHDFKTFKPAPKFEHNNTKYPLKGKHRDVACEKCHPINLKNGTEFQKFTGIKFNSCVQCHEDVHQQKMGNNCAECHNENSFLEIAKIQKFDHNKTNYPLEGAHKQVKCEKCHKAKLTDPVRHNNCMDCHSDYHNGTFIKSSEISDCQECHNMNSFSESTYSIDQHQSSNFPLKGAHMATPCFICHQKNDEWVFRELGEKCSDCHEDIHKNYISEKYYPDSKCENCHNEMQWSAIEFDHNTTDYNLKGAHEKPSCRDCHFHESEEGKYIQRFSNLGHKCTECHDDIHQNQFNEKYESCTSCHNLNKWEPTDFDHSKTRFALDGKHEKLACNKCHEIKVENGTEYTYFINNNIKCEDCH
jgi:hypothetical protein